MMTLPKIKAIPRDLIGPACYARPDGSLRTVLGSVRGLLALDGRHCEGEPTPWEKPFGGRDRGPRPSVTEAILNAKREPVGTVDPGAWLAMAADCDVPRTEMLPGEVECVECSGTGDHYCGVCDRDGDCKPCGGKGVIHGPPEPQDVYPAPRVVCGDGSGGGAGGLPGVGPGGPGVAARGSGAQALGRGLMDVYLSSPGNQMHASYLADVPALLSFATFAPWLDSYQASFGKVLIDSGAYSEMNSGKPIDGAAYRDWWPRWEGRAEAVAGLDDIRGDWRKSLRNYERFGGFPTFHDSDPPELLDDLIPIAREQGRGWIGLGLVPPRTGKEKWVRAACDRIPDDLHVHGWALREYTHVGRLDSVDSTNWFRDAWGYRNAMPFLTPAECVEIVVKRYKRWTRAVREPADASYPVDLLSQLSES